MTTKPSVTIHNYHGTRDEGPPAPQDPHKEYADLEQEGSTEDEGSHMDPGAISGKANEAWDDMEVCPHCKGVGRVAKGDDEHEQLGGEEQNLGSYDSLHSVNTSNARANGKRTRDQQPRPKSLREMNDYLSNRYHA
jgi:hypothetical protein